MPPLATGLDYVDLNFLGRPGIIATGVLHGTAGVALVDPGPATTLGNLTTALTRKGVRFEDVRHVLLTHIHLDHAGASGSLVRRFPGLRVYVHESGAQHLVDPAKLLESATRLYGDDMDRLWGDVLPVPAESVVALVGGESIEGFRVAHAPGHSRHHVVYLHEANGDAYVGDVAGVRIPPIDFTIPPTPSR